MRNAKAKPIQKEEKRKSSIPLAPIQCHHQETLATFVTFYLNSNPERQNREDETNVQCTDGVNRIWRSGHRGIGRSGDLAIGSSGERVIGKTELPKLTSRLPDQAHSGGSV